MTYPLRGDSLVKYIRILFLLLLLPCLSFADDRISGIDGFEQSTEMTKMVEDAKYELMTLWINCELDQLCICDKKMVLYNQTKNIATKMMIEQSREADAARCERIKQSYEACQIPMITYVNKDMVPCYKALRDGRYMHDNSIIDAGHSCLAEVLQPHIAINNPYAIYVFIDFLSNHKDKYPGLLNYYLKRFEQLKGTEDFETFVRCQEFMSY